MAEIATVRAGTGITCGGCPAVWTGVNRAHCSGCHATFNAVGLFDLHRRGGVCLDPEEIVIGRGPRTGERLLFLRDGVWCGPEATAELKARWAALRDMDGAA